MEGETDDKLRVMDRQLETDLPSAQSLVGNKLFQFGSHHIQKNVIQRFSEAHNLNQASSNVVLNSDLDRPQRLRQFFKMAENRKRQILERMLMD